MAGRTVAYTFTADVDNFESGLKRARNGAQDFFRALERDADRLFAGQKNAGKALETFMGAGNFAMIENGFKVVTGAAVAFGAAVVGAFAVSSKMLLDYSDKIVTLNQRTGLTTNTLQVLGHMAKVSGTDVDGLAKAVTKMEVNIGKGDDAFKKLGLSITSLKAMSPDAAFAAVGAAIGGIADPMQRAAAAVAIFGKSGAELLPVFAMDLAKARQEAEDLGLVLSGDMLFASEALGDAIDTAQEAAMRFGERLAGIVQQSPATIAAVEQLSKLFGVLSKEIDANAQTMVQWVNIAAVAAAELLDTAAAAGQLAVKIGKAGGMGWAIELAGVDKLTDGLRKMTTSLEDAVIAKIKWSAIDMGGAGVLLPGKTLPKQGKVGGTFDGGDMNAAAAAAERIAKAEEDWFLGAKKYADELERVNRQLDRIVAKALADSWGGLEQSAHRSSLSGAVENALRGGYNLPVPMGPGGKPKQYSFDNSRNYAGGAAKGAVSLSQGLQNLTNIFNLATNATGKLGAAARTLAQLAGGASGIASGIDSLKANKGVGGVKGLLGMLPGVGSIASSALSIGSAIFGLFKGKKKPAAPAPTPEVDAATWKSFQGDQLSKGSSGLAAGVGGIQITSAADLTSQATIAGMQFWAVFKTQGLSAAAASTKDVIGKLVENLSQYGSEAATAVLAPIQQQIALSENDAFKGAADGAKGFADVLASQVNARMPMTIEQFGAFGQQAMAAFEQAKAGAIATGLSTEEATKAALQAVGPLVTTAVDAAGTYGFAIDANTQSLLDQAKANGVAFATDPTDRLVMSIDALTKALGGVPPAVNAITGAVNGIPRDVDINVRTHQTGGYNPNTSTPGEDVPGFAGGSGGLMDFGRESLARLHGREAVLTEDQYSRLTAAAAGTFSVNFGDINITANDEQGGREAAEEFARMVIDGPLRTLLQDRLGLRG